MFVGRAAIGPASHEEADRVWRSIEASRPDLETLYEAGMRARGEHGPLADRVCATRVHRVLHAATPVALAVEGLVRGEPTDDLDGLFHLPTTIAAP